MNPRKNKTVKPNREYINNDAFHKALLEYNHELSCVENPRSVRVPDFIGECIILIANNACNYYSFAKYPFRDEMIGDAVENCISGLPNFDPIKFSNPFGYFTMICTRAFIRRIQKEKKYLYTKYKSIQRNFLDTDNPNVQQYGSDYATENMNEFVDKFELSQSKAREKKEQK
ncbi:hypothetical protein RZS08_07090, partial [Arthrospira platensis SPKY1]|nr:hypothetical protein [Arthrospira platensis SPKY1]